MAKNSPPPITVKIPEMHHFNLISMILCICACFLLLYNFYAQIRGINQTHFEDSTVPIDSIFLEQQKRMNDLETVISENSDPLPERSSNVSAEKLCLIHKNCVPMVADYETRWKTVPRFRLASCLIHKSMSTVVSGLMCFLQKAEQYKRENLNITDFEASKELCPSNSYHNFENITKMFWKLGWKYFIVTRDPIDRFLSGFVDRCIRKPKEKHHYCNGCAANMTCFLEAEYTKISRQIRQRKLSVGFEDRHFYPQTWRCQMREHASEYKFIKYSSDPSESVIPALVEVLEQQKVPKSYIDWIKTQLVTQRTDHSTINSEARKFLEKRLHSSPYLLELLVRLFYQDYKILGYELPF